MFWCGTARPYDGEMKILMSNNYIKTWIPVIQSKFIREIDFLSRSLKEKILPGFNSIYKEAEQVEQEKFDELSDSIYPYEDFDESNLYEEAQDEAVEYLCLAKNIRQGVINLFAVSLYHLFEQQFLEMYRWATWRIHDEPNLPLRLGCATAFISHETTIRVETFKSWKKIKELRLLANVVKHADGYSCEKLKKKRPDLFSRPSEKQCMSSLNIDTSNRKPNLPIFSPISGNGIYVQQSDFEEYTSEVESFWSEFSEEIRKLN